MRVHLDCGGNYKPGDLPPTGYMQWHEWAEVQRKAGIKQSQCLGCKKWVTPQERRAHEKCKPNRKERK